MTTGEQLIKKLGLEKVHKNNIYICRFISNFSNRVNIVYYSSLRKLSKHETERVPYSAYLTPGYELERGQLNKMFTTPLVDIKVFNGIVSNRLFMMVDMAYVKLLDKKNFSKLPESNQKKIIKNSISWFIDNKILKELTLYDLKSTDTISPFTKKWRDDKARVMGRDLAKLKDVFINKPDNSITFLFMVNATYKGEPAKSLDSTYKYSDPKKRVIMLKPKDTLPNPEKTYEVLIQITKFFDWLSVFEGESINPMQMKEILEVSDVKLHSTSPMWLYQGANYWATQLDFSIVPENRKPKRWNANHLHGEQGTLLTKEMYNILRNISFYLNQMSQKLTKKLKAKGYI